MTSRIEHEITHLMCSFCETAKPKAKVFVSKVSNKTICNDCVGFVRADMGIQNNRLEEIIKSV